MTRVLVAGIVTLAALTGCSGESAEPTTSTSQTAAVSAAPSPMSRDAAARRYLELTCAYNPVNGEWSAALDAYTGEPGSATPDNLRELSARYATVATDYAQALQDPAYPWPYEVMSPVTEWAVSVYSRAAYANALAQPDSTWELAPMTTLSGDSAARIRLGLGLGPAGTGCDSITPNAQS
mgnify:CR=1 FL=1